MNISELYQKFTKGETLHTLGVRESRALLDYCRSKLLGMGRTLKAAATGTTAEAKAALLEAHRELQRAGLADATQVYNSAAHQDPLGGRTVEECENLLADFRAHNAAPKKREFRATPATEADLRRQFEIAKQPRPAPARVPTATPAKPSPAPARPAAPAKSTNYGQLLPPKKTGPPPSAPPPFKRKPEDKDTYKSASDLTLLKTAAGKAGPDFIKGAEQELARRGWTKSGKAWMRKA
jgi:hypothetical protein